MKRNGRLCTPYDMHVLSHIKAYVLNRFVKGKYYIYANIKLKKILD